jgi:K+ transporter
MSVMALTTILGSLVMTISWDTHPAFVLLFVAVYLPYELLYLSATLTKVAYGGWVALMVAGIVSTINLVWWWGTKIKSEYTTKEKVGGSINPADSCPRDGVLRKMIIGVHSEELEGGLCRN